MWKNGKAAMTMSCSPKPSKSFMPSNCWRFATRLRCVSMTPLGKPVVPLEYGSAADPVGQLPVREGSSTRPIDERGLGGQARGVPQHVLGDRDLRNRDGGAITRDDHSRSSCDRASPRLPTVWAAEAMA